MNSADQSNVTYLFADDAMIARKKGVVRGSHPCRKLPQSVISSLKTWQAPSDDQRVYIYGTALRTEDGKRILVINIVVKLIGSILAEGDKRLLLALASNQSPINLAVLRCIRGITIATARS